MMKRTISRILVVLSLGVLAACSSDKLPPPKTEQPSNVGNTTGNGGQVATVTTGNDQSNALVPSELRQNNSVYFDFDSFAVKDEFKPLLEKNAAFLRNHSSQHIVVQGNTDERGGSEYNLALGQKRAEAVRRALTLLGVADSQIEAVSFGKEKPKALGHDEQAWAQNRRADIVYQ